MPGVANPKVRGFGYSHPSSWKGTDGTFFNPSARHSVTLNPDREAIARDEDINSFGDLYPDTPGVQLFDAAASFDACQQSYADLKEFFIGALGEEEAAGSAITLGAGPNNDTQFTYSAGAPQKIVIVTGSDGKKYPRGIKTDAAGVATYNMKLPPGVTTTAVANPSALAGGIFRYLFGTSARDYMLEFDRRGQAKQIKYRALGAVISAASIKFERRKRLQWMFGFKAAQWEKNPGAPAFQLADPAVMTTPFLSFCADIMIQDLAAPGVAAPITCKSLAFSFAPELLEETGTSGLDGSGNVPGSDISGFTRSVNWKDRLKTTLTYPDAQYHDDFATWVGVKKQMFVIFYPGAPGKASAVNRQIIWFPEVVLTAEPKLVNADNAEAQELTWNIGRDPSLSLPACLIAMTNS